MGYTHYWSTSKNNANWDKFIQFVSLAILHENARGIKIADGFGENEPELNERRVWLNGSDENDESHETFSIRRTVSERGFCKTNRKPYDTLVVACLVAGEELGIITRWSSDGDAEELADGIELAQKILRQMEK